MNRSPRDLVPVSRTVLSVAGTLAVVLFGTAVAVRTVDVETTVRTVGEADHGLLAAAVAVYVCSWPVRGRRYGDVLAAMEQRCTTTFLTLTVFLSQTANLVIPARAGDGVRAYLLYDRRDVPYSIGVASLAVERAFDLVAIATVGTVAFALIEVGGGADLSASATAGWQAAILVAAIGVVVSAGTVVVARTDRRIGPAVRSRFEGHRLAGVVDGVVRFGASVRAVADSPGAMRRVYAGSLVVWVLDVLTAVLVLAALLGGLTAGALSTAELVVVGTLAVSVGNLAKVLPLSQGGIGLYEAAFTGLVVGVTPIAPETALAAAVLDHALKNVVTLAGGAAAAVVLNASLTAEVDDSDEATTEPPGF